MAKNSLGIANEQHAQGFEIVFNTLDVSNIRSNYEEMIESIKSELVIFKSSSSETSKEKNDLIEELNSKIKV